MILSEYLKRISSSPCGIVINHDIIRILNEVRISSSLSDIAINHDIIRVFNEEFLLPPMT